MYVIDVTDIVTPPEPEPEETNDTVSNDSVSPPEPEPEPVVVPECQNGDRDEDIYCNDERVFVPQKSLGESCGFNFECDSHKCKEDICKKPNIIQRIVNWFTRLFN